jgi:predicted HicB family RNase H-like nuclease
MKDITYNGFTGSVYFSEADLIYYGNIEGITDLITYEGESVLELTDAFHDMVDEHLIDCVAENIGS